MKRYLFVGLGNPGTDYARTRHNIGFMGVDALAARLGAPGWVQGRYADVTEATFRGRPVRLVKPTTYMNLSGKAVAYHVQDFLKGATETLLVLTDELALPFGTLRLRGKGSAGGHNGLKDIEAALASGSYPRLRMGIGSNYPKGAQVDYVLEPFMAEEERQLPTILTAAAEACETFAFRGLSAAMSAYNKSWLPIKEEPDGTSSKADANKDAL